MSVFLSTRALAGGGGVAPAVTACAATVSSYVPLSLNELKSFVHGRDVLIATHGFNVNRASGIECLSEWEPLLQLPATAAFVGLLWPGDSDSLYALAYPAEPENAMEAGTMAGQFIDANFADAASISIAAHSLGNRVLLQTIRVMSRRIRRAILMAGAVSDDCLTAEFADVPGKVDSITVLSSMRDEVLQWAFPVGNLAAEIMGHDHPWWQAALGRLGPRVAPPNLQPPGRIPDAWDYGHLDYLRTDPAAQMPIQPPTAVPVSGAAPLNGAAGWQQAWSASFVSSRFR
jgi:Alpha/beta hydrolase of unknown function (DUF900)